MKMTKKGEITYIDHHLGFIAEDLNMSIDELEKNKQMAIMKDVGFGNRDVGRPVLWFTVMLNECVGSLQIIFEPDYHDFIKDYGVYDVKDLEGKPIWVSRSGTSIRWLEPCKIRK
jgi:hypothetical protein